MRAVWCFVCSLLVAQSAFAFLANGPMGLRHHPSIVTRSLRSMRMAAGVIDLPEGETAFQEMVLDGEGPILVIFGAKWCGPCQLVEPITKKTAAQYEGKLKVIKVNTEQHEPLVGKYSIYGLPYLMVFENGEIIGTHEGAIGGKGMEKLLADAVPSLVES
ncbi:unnamed protein product [Chrysoparadoxa australica]